LLRGRLYTAFPSTPQLCLRTSLAKKVAGDDRFPPRFAHV
jgi:hypothetical protein